MYVRMMYVPTSFPHDEMTDMMADGKKKQSGGKRGATEREPAPGLNPKTDSGKRQSQRQPNLSHPGSRSSMFAYPCSDCLKGPRRWWRAWERAWEGVHVTLPSLNSHPPLSVVLSLTSPSSVICSHSGYIKLCCTHQVQSRCISQMEVHSQLIALPGNE